MNTISKSHKRFSERLNNPRVLTNPKEFLGPNYEVVGDNYAYEAGCVVYAVTYSRASYYATKTSVARWTTIELIAMHKILENHQQPLTFFPMFLEVL